MIHKFIHTGGLAVGVIVVGDLIISSLSLGTQRLGVRECVRFLPAILSDVAFVGKLELVSVSFVRLLVSV